jgi:hypothetical protein
MAAKSSYVFRTVLHPSAPTMHKMETGAFICVWFHHLAEDRRVSNEIAQPGEG